MGFGLIKKAAQKTKLHNLQYDEGCNHMVETETENDCQVKRKCNHLKCNQGFSSKAACHKKKQNLPVIREL